MSTNEAKVAGEIEKDIPTEKQSIKSGANQKHGIKSTEKPDKEARKPTFVGHIQDHDEMSGYLYKRRGGFGRHMPNAWQLRYFTLRDGIMYYFEDSGGIAKPRGKIDLKTENCTFLNVMTVEGAPSPYTMQIVPGGWEEKWKLCAQSTEDMELWVSAIMRHITDERKREPAPLNLKEYESSDDEDDCREAVCDESPGFISAVRPPLPPGNSSLDTYSRCALSLPQTSNSKVKGKHKLRLQSDTGGGSEELEFALVLVILNMCALFAYTSSIAYGIVLLLTTNVVVTRTLLLRSARLHRHIDAMNATAKPIACDPDMEKSVSSLPPAESPSQGPENKPDPGTTMKQNIGGVAPDNPTHTWCACDHSSFNVRVGPDYARNKKKGPSGPPIYEPIAVDTFCAKSRIDHVARYISFANVKTVDTHNEFVPPILLVQIQMPSDSPPLFETIEDGPGWAIVMYFKITENACEQLKDLSTASPAVRLFSKYCELAEKDPAWRGRFKVINFCSNLEEMGVPNVIMSYNAKPVLIRRTGSIFRGNGDCTYLEIDIHVHKFANLAKKSIHALSSRCSLMYMQIGFVVEGREDDELPEALFACVGVNRPEEDQAEFLLDPPDSAVD